MLTHIIMPIIKNKIILAVTKLFKIEQLEIEFNNNQNRKYEIISGTGCDAVMILPIMDDKIFFIKEYAAAIDSYTLTLPKGRIDEGELLLEAANRELQEEIGFKSHDLTHVYTLDLAPGYINHKTHVILAKGLVPSKLEGDEPEELEVVDYKLSEINHLLDHNKNLDSRVIACLYIYENLKKK